MTLEVACHGVSLVMGTWKVITVMVNRRMSMVFRPCRVKLAIGQ